MSRIAPLAGLLLFASLLGGCTSAPVAAKPAQRAAVGTSAAQAGQVVPASSACFRYEGRFDFADTNAPGIVWQASRISLDFDGDRIHLLFDDAKGQNFFNAQVDGSNTIIGIHEGSSPTNLFHDHSMLRTPWPC